MNDCKAFAGDFSDLTESEVLAGTITGFYDEVQGGVIVEKLVEHSKAFILSEVRIEEIAGARFVVDVSRTTATEVMLLVERLAGEEEGDLVFAGARVGLLA